MKKRKSRLNKDFPNVTQDLEKFFFDNRLEELKIQLTEINNKLWIAESTEVKGKKKQYQKIN